MKETIQEISLKAETLLRNGDSYEAAKLVRAVTPDPCHDTKIMLSIAFVCFQTGQFDKAIQWYEAVLQRVPCASVYNMLARICQNIGRLSKAKEYAGKAVNAEPDNATILLNFADILMSAGQMKQGFTALKKAVRIEPKNAVVNSNLLTSMHYQANISQETIFNEHKRWAEIHASADMAKKSHDNPPDLDRRLRIGYISPDFRMHSIAYFFEPLLEEHDRQAVKVYGYGNVEQPDDFTKRLEKKFDCYHNICGLDVKTVVNMIERDRIDILVDLTGHMNNNSLGVLAHKPAPIQVTYMGYAGTTGMQQVDYRLTDILAEPPEVQKFYTEELAYIPQSHLCYRPPDYAPPIKSLPADKKGYITFGSFNTNIKIDPFIIKLWAEILGKIDSSNMLLKFRAGADPKVRDHYFKLFERLGIDRSRLRIYGSKTPVEHLQMYNQVDIALDTYPYNGATTTCEAIYMGVPTISLKGKTYVSRLALSVLSPVSLESFIASTPAEYVTKAVELAQNREYLTELRVSMRERMSNSSLCDAKSFASRAEVVYRKMWHKWCNGTKATEQTSASHENVKYDLPQFLVKIDSAAKAGEIEQATGILSEAAQYLEETMNLDANDIDLWRLFGTHLINTGEISRLVEILQKSIEAMPWTMQIRFYHLYSLHYLPDVSLKVIFDGHKQWGQVLAPANVDRLSHSNIPDSSRKLRIGYISPDFREHSVTKFFEPLLEEHNRQAVEVYGYGSVAAQDQTTERLKCKFDHYRDIYGVDDESAARMIEADKIDILVDLAGHTENNRLLVMARKPAPIQITYLGYINTTGLRQIDYRLTDALAESAQSQAFHTEEVIFLPEGFLCYKPPDACPAVAPMPAGRNGYITFGSFNDNGKINPDIIAIWAEILKANEGSHFLLKFRKADEQGKKDHYYRQFEKLGIGKDRLEIQGSKTFAEHMQLYGEVDIALDSYPYNGTTTTCETLWMGVPVISLFGQRHLSRVGLSILSRVGLEFFACSTSVEYIAKATSLAKKPEALAKIRATMRQRMAESPLLDAKKFAHNIETAYRKMWHKWCQHQSAS